MVVYSPEETGHEFRTRKLILTAAIAGYFEGQGGLNHEGYDRRKVRGSKGDELQSGTENRQKD